MRNTLSTATIACVVKRIRKRTTDPKVGGSNPHEYQQQKKVKVRLRLQGGGTLGKAEVRGLGTTYDRRGMSEQEGRGGW